MTDTFQHRGVTYRTVKQSLTVAEPACTHRGAVTETISTTCCDGIGIRACDVHGACIDTRENWDRVRGLMAREGRLCAAKCCAGCADLA